MKLLNTLLGLRQDNDDWGTGFKQIGHDRYLVGDWVYDPRGLPLGFIDHKVVGRNPDGHLRFETMYTHKLNADGYWITLQADGTWKVGSRDRWGRKGPSERLCSSALAE